VRGRFPDWPAGRREFEPLRQQVGSTNRRSRFDRPKADPQGEARSAE